MNKKVTVQDLADLLDIRRQGIRYYINSGYLRAQRENRKHYIYLEDFAHFLCNYPQFRRRFYEIFNSMSSEDEWYVDALNIHEYISSHDIYFNVNDVADMCDFTRKAIWYWLHIGELKKDVNGKYFSKKELKRFFAAHPSVARYKTVDI